MDFSFSAPRIQKDDNIFSKRFCLTQRQKEVINEMRSRDFDEVCLYGGGRSGKSILICIFLIQRAILAPHSHHIIFRNTAISARNSIFNDTLLSKIANFQQFQQQFASAHIDKTRMIVTLHNGSTIQIFGMNNIDKVLGIECSSLYFNECSEIEYDKIKVPISRLVEKVRMIRNNNKEEYLKNTIFYDFNPNFKTHWTYKYFIENCDPNTGRPLNGKKIFVSRLNPADNIQNIDAGYFQRMKEHGGEKRFINGEFEDEVQGAIFTQQNIIQANNHTLNGVSKTKLRQIMTQIVIGVDPAVTDGENSDNTGIIVAGTNGDNFYILEDCSGKYSEEVVCAIVNNLYQKWSANCVIVEVNQGGSWIPNGVLMYCKAHKIQPLPIKTVHATFSKRLRAEPVAVLYSNGKVKHIQYFDCENQENTVENKLIALEEEMLSYTGSKKEKSPDRLDAMVYAVTFMFENKPQISTYQLLNGFFTK